MKACFALFRQQLMVQLQYRASFWSKLATNIFWACTHAAILVAFYRFGAGNAALTLSQAIAMNWIREIAANLLPGFGMDMGVWTKICKGEVAYDLVRPMDIYTHWYVSALAVKLAPCLLNVLPITLAALIMPGSFALRLSVSPLCFCAGLLTLTTGFFFSCAVICLSYAACMDANVGPHPANVLMLITQILAGSILPLQLWPDKLQPFLSWQPFAGLMDLPLRFMVGSADLSELPRVLLLQALWGAAIFLLGRFWMRRNLRRLIVQGG